MYGAVNTPIYPYNQMGQITPNGHGYTGFQGHTLPGRQIVQFGGLRVTTSSIRTIQAAFPPGGLFSFKRFVL